MLTRALVAILLAGCGAAGAAAPIGTARSVPASTPESAALPRPSVPVAGTQTVTYCTNDGQPLAMDISVPTPPPAAPAPAVLYVHGGGWEHGDRKGGGFLDQLRPQLLARGFVVASIDYRLAPGYPWPAQIVDSKCAVRYLRAHASTYGIDGARIGAWGGSAGGHLVALMGTTDATAGFDIGAWSEQSSRLAAVVDLFGPADLTLGGWGQGSTRTITKVFGSAPGSLDETLTAASPVTWIDRADSPFLIMHGDDDATVPLAQSVAFAAKLQAAGVRADLVVVRNGPHGLGSDRQEPSRDQLVAQIVDFFTKTLRA